MAVILGFIMLVASFIVVATLVMLVLEKTREIAVLRSMGATTTSIMKIFVAEGLAIGAVGTGFGLLLGLGTTSLVSRVGIPLDPEVYYISHLPVLVDGGRLRAGGARRHRALLPGHHLPGHPRRPARAGRGAARRVMALPARHPGARQGLPHRRAAARGAAGRDPLHRGRRDGGAHRPVGRREEHLPAPGGRPRRPHGRAGRLRGARPGLPRRGGAGQVPQRVGGLRLPEPPPAARVHRARERHDARAGPAASPGGGPAPRRGEPGAGGALRAGSATGPASCPAGSSSGWRWPARWCLQPRLLLADEPTGNLDPQTAEGIHDLLQQLNRDLGITGVVVTHNEKLAESLGRRVRLLAGRLA